jgi:hypothetical protein
MHATLLNYMYVWSVYGNMFNTTLIMSHPVTGFMCAALVLITNYVARTCVAFSSFTLCECVTRLHRLS